LDNLTSDQVYEIERAKDELQEELASSIAQSFGLRSDDDEQEIFDLVDLDKVYGYR